MLRKLRLKQNNDFLIIKKQKTCTNYQLKSVLFVNVGFNT